MFANKAALETLVKTDASASETEKERILTLLNGCVTESGETMENRRDRLMAQEVMQFSDAAWLLGYKGPRSVYAAVRNRVLEGYYGGSSGHRASGVLVSSIRRRLGMGRSLAIAV